MSTKEMITAVCQQLSDDADLFERENLIYDASIKPRLVLFSARYSTPIARWVDIQLSDKLDNIYELTHALLRIGATNAGAGYKEFCLFIRDMLHAKNDSYGNSALEPVRIFSKADPGEQLRVRLDDKLSRLIKGKAYVGDNDVVDLIGYLVLLLVYEEMHNGLPKD